MRAPATLRRLVPAGMSGVVASLCGIGLLATSGWLITRAAERPPVFVLSVAIGAVQAFALGRGIARYVQRLRIHGASLARLGDLRVDLFDTLEPRVPGSAPELASGSVLAGFVADAELVTEGFAKRASAGLDVTASVLLGAGLVCAVSPVLGAELLSGSLVVIGLSLALGRLARRAALAQAATRAELANAVFDTVEAARELVAYGRQDVLDDRLEEVRRREASAGRRRALATGAGRAVAIAAGGVLLVGVVSSGLAEHRAGGLSGVLLAVVVFTALAVLDQCIGLPSVLADLGAAAAAKDRLERLRALEPPVSEPAFDRSPPGGPVPVALDRVAVAANGQTLVEGVSLDLPAGSRTALVGRSGSGKTSALYALLHFLECADGSATVGGVPVSEMSRAGIARHLGWLGERTHLFATTLADNLRIARPDATEADCRRALERVGLGEWFRSLPEGMSTVLGTGGRPVSSGERQRFGLARALLAGGTVLLLDEPTAHLDPASAPEVLGELMGAAGERSVLVVSHEPEVGRYVEQVVSL